MTDLLLNQALLIKKCQISCQQPIIVGVSGGPDSLCLADQLIRLHVPLFIAHFDHHIRAESTDDCRKVEAFCNEKGVKFVHGEGDVKVYAETAKISLEEAARILRYQFLFDTARFQKAEAVAVAHTADDQVETVLMHFLRGAGLSGLKGMAYRYILPEWDQQIPIIRPLLGVWREEILAYIQDMQLVPVVDQTNLDPAYFRNRIRHQLVPYLADYNPQIKQTIWRMALSLGSDYELINHQIEDCWPGLDAVLYPEAVLLSWEPFERLDPGMKRNIFRKAIQHILPSLRNIDFESIERALAFLQKPSRSRRAHLLADIWLEKSGEKLVIRKTGAKGWNGDWPSVELTGLTAIPVDGEVLLDENRKIRIETIPTDHPMSMIGNDPNQAWFDGEKIELPLYLRTWKAGDRFSPIGFGGRHIKLSDFFINQHVPMEARKKYPLIFSGDELIWIPGLRAGETGLISEQTKKVCHLHLLEG